MDRLELLAEAERRGILPDDKRALFDEAVSRGLIQKQAQPEPEPSATGGTLRNIGMGALKGASDIGATLLRPVDAALNATGLTTTTNEQRRASLSEFFSENADPSSLAFKGGELGADIAGTAGAGGVLAKGVTAASTVAPMLAKYAPKLAAALESGGFRLGTAPATTTAGRVADVATRAGAGAAVGGTSAALINPEDATTGAVIGTALPGAAKVVGMAGKALASEVSPEVNALYQKAKNLGINVPADRIVNSKPLNALAASLNYVPMSGRAGTEEAMVSQLNRAVSRTFGQDSDNVISSLRKAQTALGDKFETTLKGNKVAVDEQFMTDLASHVDTANKELGSEGAKIIGRQVDEILSKVAADGAIDGQTAYNIKKTLDRIGARNAPEAYYARDLKKSLMGALDRSLGEEDAKAFATVRKQYGNMLDVESIAQNGAEGGVSVGRLANLRGVNNPELKDLADIAAQFVRARESPHGAAQRVVGGLAIGTTSALAPGTAPLMATGMVAGRAANAALNSRTLKELMLGQSALPERARALAGNPALRSLAYVWPTGRNE